MRKNMSLRDLDTMLEDTIKKMNEAVLRGDEAIKAINKILAEMEREALRHMDDHGKDEQRDARGN